MNNMELPINEIICGDCLKVLKDFPDNTIDTVLTDPPYGLEFMGKEWDKLNATGRDSVTMQQWHYNWTKEVLRVAKPGAFMFCFGGTRTFHRLTCAIEDAGWQIRDTMMWMYGSGFPKSLDISKAIDKRKGKRRKIVGKRKGAGSKGNTFPLNQICDITVSVSKLAKLWDGYGTAFKPAYEPIVVAMKPVDGNFAKNAEKWGVAGLNVDGCRINYVSDYDAKHQADICRGQKNAINGKFFGGSGKFMPSTETPLGRWPANLILDENSAKMLDEQSGLLKSGDNCVRTKVGNFLEHGGIGKVGDVQTTYGDVGGASRFFYCAKASKSERGKNNNHPTVKPLSLIEYLCKLTKTPTGGIVLDPFAGSGTTGVACIKLQRDFILIEKEREYCNIAKQRLAKEGNNIY